MEPKSSCAEDIASVPVGVLERWLRQEGPKFMIGLAHSCIHNSKGYCEEIETLEDRISKKQGTGFLFSVFYASFSPHLQIYFFSNSDSELHPSSLPSPTCLQIPPLLTLLGTTPRCTSVMLCLTAIPEIMEKFHTILFPLT